MPVSSRSPAARPPSQRWATWSVILISYLVVLVPVVIAEGPRERVRWYVAAAESHWERGNQAAAQDLLNEILQWAPNDSSLWMRRAEWHQEMGSEEKSLADAARALDAATGAERVELLMQRAHMLQHFQRWRDAVEDWKEIRRLAEGEPDGLEGTRRRWSRPQLLNGLAYARALAHLELSEALVEATEALRDEPDSPDILDTRGYILFLLGRYDEALQDLDQAVLGKSRQQTWRRFFEEQRQQLVDLSALNRADQYYQRSLAVILYHRSLVHGRLHPEKAQRDEQRLRDELGFEPGPELF
jgi:tetratricopeptide (TPR) repeat protein